MVEGRHSPRRAGERGPKKQFSFRFKIDTFNGELTPERLEDPTPKFIEPHLTATQLKVWEARYFLRMLRRYAHDEAALLYHLDAFLTAFRAITFTLQREAHSAPGFQEWYEGKRLEMQAHPFLPLFVELRNESEKRGFRAPVLSIVLQRRHHLDGSLSEGVRFEIHGRLIENPFERMRESLSFLQELVSEALARGFLSTERDRMELPFRLEILAEGEDKTWQLIPLEAASGTIRYELLDEDDAVELIKWGKDLW